MTVAIDHAYVDGRFLNPNAFIKPQDPEVQAIARSIVEKLGDQDSVSARLREAYNYVTLNIKYVTDKEQYGYEDVWAMPDECLKRGMGDCDDTAFLMCSLLQALGVRARVVLGEWKGGGHAWVEAWVDGQGGILETTTMQPFSGFADPTNYVASYVTSTGQGPTEDPFVSLFVYVLPGVIMFGTGAFLMIDDAQDAFKLDLSESLTEGHPGEHGMLKGVTIPGLGPHIHHWWLGILLVILAIIVLAVGVVLWLLKYL